MDINRKFLHLCRTFVFHSSMTKKQAVFLKEFCFPVIHMNGKHTQTWHIMYVDSCTDILYFCTQLVQMDCTSVYTQLYCKFVLTNESQCKISFMNRFDQSQLRCLGIIHSTTCSLITACLPQDKVKKSFCLSTSSYFFKNFDRSALILKS